MNSETGDYTPNWFHLHLHQWIIFDLSDFSLDGGDVVVSFDLLLCKVFNLFVWKKKNEDSVGFWLLFFGVLLNVTRQLTVSDVQWEARLRNILTKFNRYSLRCGPFVWLKNERKARLIWQLQYHTYPDAADFKLWWERLLTALKTRGFKKCGWRP